MAAFSSAAVTNFTPQSCTVTFNAAAVDLDCVQVKRVRDLFDRLLANMQTSGGAGSGTITLPTDFGTV